MAAFDEETFGPVAAITRVRDADEAIRLANQTEFGLARVAVDRAGSGPELIRRLDAGAVFVNAMVASDPRLPFGGIKRSGYGRELGVHGMREFMNIKTVFSAEPAPRLVIRPDEVEVFDRGSGVRTVPYVGAWNCERTGSPPVRRSLPSAPRSRCTRTTSRSRCWSSPARRPR